MSSKYREVANWIEDQINNGSFVVGEKIPTEYEIKERFGYSRQTVRQAISELINEGKLESIQGSGTFVKAKKNVNKVKTKTVGVITTYINDYIFPSIISNIEQVLVENDYSMHIAFTRNRVENERRALEMMLEADVDAFIVEPTKSALPNPNLDIYKEIVNKDIPIVFLNANYPSIDIPCVSLDDRKAGELAVDYLIGKNHKDIMGVFKVDDIQGHLRYAGYVDAFKKHKLELIDDGVCWYTTEGFNEKDIENLIMKDIKRFTSIFCYNDELALLIISMLEKHNIKVPEDISIIGIDNLAQLRGSGRNITTINNPIAELGKRSASEILSLIKNRKHLVKEKFKPVLVEGDSVKIL